MPLLASSLMGIILAMPVAPLTLTLPATPVPLTIEEWAPENGDSVIVDTKENMGYLIHPNDAFMAFPVVTGQRRNVWYIGRSYNAATPTWRWKIEQLETKGDRVTFGPEGRFLRLFKDGDGRTAYGFHEHRSEKEMFSEDAEKRFRSMGCIIVRHDIMDILVKTYAANGSIDVTTQYGVEDVLSAVLARQ